MEKLNLTEENFWVFDEHKRQCSMAKNKNGIVSTDLINKALAIAFEAHKNQSDKAGHPYILHPLHIADQMKGEFAVCVALLHDVVEDSGMTFEKLSDEGIPATVIAALKILTHDQSVPYMDYIKNIKESGNSLAINIKLADLRHNSDLSRLDNIDERMIQRYFKYMEAMAILEDVNWKRDDMQYIYNAMKTRVLDIKSDAPSVGGRLSNFTKRKFIFDGVQCGSIEGVLQSFKFPDPVKQEEVCALYWGSAKKAGKNQDWQTEQALYWQGVSYPRDSVEYQELLDRLYQAAFDQDESFRDDLRVKAKEYKLTHSIGRNDIRETILTKDEFISRLEKLRREE